MGCPVGQPFGGLPEEIVDHIYNLARVNIDKKDIVIIPNPAIGAVNRR